MKMSQCDLAKNGLFGDGRTSKLNQNFKIFLSGISKAKHEYHLKWNNETAVSEEKIIFTTEHCMKILIFDFFSS